MTRCKFAFNQNDNYAEIKQKKYLLDDNVYAHQKKVRHITLPAMLLAGTAIVYIILKFNLPIKASPLIVGAVILAASVILQVTSLPKDIDKYITYAEENMEDSNK